MSRPFSQGLHEVGTGTWAYLQPDGSWGLNNAGLVVDGEHSLLVDTLFDLAHTRRMLDAMADASPAAKRVDTVLNTHANGDHCWGNQLVEDAEIVASRRAAAEMEALPPARVALLLRAARILKALGPLGRGLGAVGGAVGLTKVRDLVDAAPFVASIFGRYDFDGIRLVPPSRTFDDELTLTVGDREVQLFEVGPAHTEGDILAWVPDQRVVYTGDILFIDAHPIIWAGPVHNWIEACDRILALKPEIIVPGHGPLTDAAGVRRVRDYLRELYDETRRRFDAGLTREEAVADLHLDGYGDWTEGERLAVNVDTIYRELSGRTEVPDPVDLFARMSRLARQL